jgi:hypothetical protein
MRACAAFEGAVDRGRERNKLHLRYLTPERESMQARKPSAVQRRRYSPIYSNLSARWG